jgi:hypothetical protein
MWILWIVISVGLILLTLIDAFETIVQPRRVTHAYRFARLYYTIAWQAWRTMAVRISSHRKREAFLSVFGPLSMIGLLCTWLLILIGAFALFHFSLHTPLSNHADDHGFGAYLYFSGTTLFTLGYGDITPTAAFGRIAAVVESGLGFAFLAVIISYLPVLYQAYSQRETTIGLLDARAGSPPTAGEFLTRIARGGNFDNIDGILGEWERWSADLLEIQLSFPVLTYYRSQHDNQCWLGALAMILDTCALLLVETKRANTYQTQLTFAIARHAAVDLSLILKARPHVVSDVRFSREQREQLRAVLAKAGVPLTGGDTESRLAELRSMYEPFLYALAERFLFDVPPIVSSIENNADNWQRSAWMRRAPAIGSLPAARVEGDHFE